MERGKLPEIPVPAWPQSATARLTNHPLSNREFLEVPYIVGTPICGIDAVGRDTGEPERRDLVLHQRDQRGHYDSEPIP